VVVVTLKKYFYKETNQNRYEMNNERREFLRFLMGATALTVGIIIGDEQEKEQSSRRRISLAEAQSNQEVRQAYLDQYLNPHKDTGLEDKIKNKIEDRPVRLTAKYPLSSYCEGVYYDQTGELIIEFAKKRMRREDKEPFMEDLKRKTENGQYHAYHPMLLSEWGKRKTSPIYIGRKMFERKEIFQTDDDVWSAILTHENVHVEQFARGLDIDPREPLFEEVIKGRISSLTVALVIELDAYHKQLRAIKDGEFKVNKLYHQVMIDEYDQQRHLLEEALKSARSPQEREYISRARETRKIP
jgi:hypothetical protein